MFVISKHIVSDLKITLQTSDTLTSHIYPPLNKTFISLYENLIFIYPLTQLKNKILQLRRTFNNPANQSKPPVRPEIGHRSRNDFVHEFKSKL